MAFSQIVLRLTSRRAAAMGLFLAVVAAFGIVGRAPTASAAPINLTDDNSTLVVDPALPTLISGYTVESQQQLLSERWFLRVGTSGTVMALNDTSHFDYGGDVNSGGNKVALTFSDKTPNRLGTLTLTITLDGQPISGNASGFSQELRIQKPLFASVSDVTIYRYADYDLFATADDASVEFLEAAGGLSNSVDQIDATGTKAFVTFNPSGTATVERELDIKDSLDDTLDELLSGSGDLNGVDGFPNSPIGPGDLTMAFAATYSTLPSFAIVQSQTNITIIPEPSVVCLLGTLAAAFCVWRLR